MARRQQPTGLSAPPVLSLCCAGRQIVATMGHRRTEDLLSMARRHVAEGEAHVARQEILIAELYRDGHTELAVKARELLTTFETSLRLMREDLSRIENESRRLGSEAAPG
jgi:hypothetical protein